MRWFDELIKVNVRTRPAVLLVVGGFGQQSTSVGNRGAGVSVPPVGDLGYLACLTSCREDLQKHLSNLFAMT